MTQKLEIYRCNICGNLIEVVRQGEGTLVCCGHDMELLTDENHTGEAETHKPIIEIEEDKRIIRIGQIPHTMKPEHYVEFIEVMSNDKKYVKRKYLNPEEEPILEFECKCKSPIIAREMCNIHGLWNS